MSKTIFVGNLPWSATDDDLARVFSDLAEIESSRVVTDRETGRSRGFGFIEVPDEDFDRVLEAAQGLTMDDRQLTISAAQERKPRQYNRY